MLIMTGSRACLSLTLRLDILAPVSYTHLDVYKRQALAEAKEATTLAPMNPYARRTYGSVLSQMRRWDEAETQYRHAVALFPQAAKYYVYLAQVLRKQNKIDEAVASIEEAISRDKSSVQSLVANMRSKGYWNGEPNTFAVNAQVKDGIRACMIDQTCFF